MTGAFATLLVDATVSPSPSGGVITRLDCLHRGAVVGTISVTEQMVHIAPADGGQMLAVRMIDLAAACLNASRAASRGDAA